MKDEQLIELLKIFNNIEELMVKNGAPEFKENGDPTSFSDKVKSFDKFPKNNINDMEHIGNKFYYNKSTEEYCIKDEYKDEIDIDEELEAYSNYKDYKKKYWEYRQSILSGNYNILKQIGHARNQIMHIYDYNIANYNYFVNVCKLMIEYLENPNKEFTIQYDKEALIKEDTPKKYDSIIKNIDNIIKPFDTSIYNKLIDSIFNIKVYAILLSSLALLIVINKYTGFFNYLSKEINISSNIIILFTGIMFLFINKLRALKYDYIYSYSRVALSWLFSITISILLANIFIQNNCEWYCYIAGSIILYFIFIFINNAVYEGFYDTHSSFMSISIIILVILLIYLYKPSLTSTAYLLIVLGIVFVLYNIENWGVFTLIVLIIAFFIFYNDEKNYNSYSTEKAVKQHIKSKNDDKNNDEKNYNSYSTQKVANQYIKSKNNLDKKNTVIKKIVMYVNTQELNIREEPNSKARVLSKIKYGDKIIVLKQINNWVYILNKGWVYSKYLSIKKPIEKKFIKEEVKIKKLKRSTSHKASIEKRKKLHIWHCNAKSIRATGWVEKLGKNNAIKGALHQCEIRRVSEKPCRITNCFKIN